MPSVSLTPALPSWQHMEPGPQSRLFSSPSVRQTVCTDTNRSSDNWGIISSRMLALPLPGSAYFWDTVIFPIMAQPASRQAPGLGQIGGDAQHVTSPPGNFHSVAPSGFEQTQSRRRLLGPKCGLAAGPGRCSVQREGYTTRAEPLRVAHAPGSRPACNHRPPFQRATHRSSQAPTATLHPAKAQDARTHSPPTTPPFPPQGTQPSALTRRWQQVQPRQGWGSAGLFWNHSAQTPTRAQGSPAEASPQGRPAAWLSAARGSGLRGTNSGARPRPVLGARSPQRVRAPAPARHLRPGRRGPGGEGLGGRGGPPPRAPARPRALPAPLPGAVGPGGAAARAQEWRRRRRRRRRRGPAPRPVCRAAGLCGSAGGAGERAGGRAGSAPAPAFQPSPLAPPPLSSLLPLPFGSPLLLSPPFSSLHLNFPPTRLPLPRPPAHSGFCWVQH